MPSRQATVQVSSTWLCGEVRFDSGGLVRQQKHSVVLVVCGALKCPCQGMLSTACCGSRSVLLSRKCLLSAARCCLLSLFVCLRVACMLGLSAEALLNGSWSQLLTSWFSSNAWRSHLSCCRLQQQRYRATCMQQFMRTASTPLSHQHRMLLCGVSLCACVSLHFCCIALCLAFMYK